MNCYDMIYSNEYFDLIVRSNEYLPSFDSDICGLDAGNNFTVLFAPAAKYGPLSVSNFNYNTLPNCYEPLSMEALDAAGILQVRETPSLNLDGEGVLIGFLDSGIDTMHPAFLDEAGRSRVVAVWDQNQRNSENAGMPAVSAADVPQVYYGRVYSGDTIPLYGNRDATGHGTYVASVAAGSDRGTHSGAAPRADIAMVQLKQVKQHLRDYYFIPDDAICYGESDLIFGLQFLNELARMRNQSLVICISVGSALSSHSGNNALAYYLNSLAVVYRRCVVTATGNEAASRHHFYGSLVLRQDDNFLLDGTADRTQDYVEVEIVVENNVCGFIMEQWAVAPAQYEVAVISPSGEMHPRVGIQTTGGQVYEYTLDGTLLELDYSYPEATTGNQLVYYRFTTPAPGVWRVRVFSRNRQQGNFHMFLPSYGLMCGRVYFLASNPDSTIMNPGNAGYVLTFAGYNQRQNAILLESGRGYTIDGRIKPDLAAPAYLVEGASAGRGTSLEELQYVMRTGTSAAVAIGAGAAAMYLQWCDERGDFSVNTTQVKIFMIRGARQFAGDLYPNRQWGYGALDLYESFRRL